MIVLVLWTVLGIAGTVIAALRREPGRARRGIRAIACVWAVYLAVLLTVSHAQPVHSIPPNTARCFDEMCFTVTAAEDLEGFRVRGKEPERLLRVSVLVSNRGRRHTEAEGTIRAVLLDAQGRRWAEVPGLSGVPLTTPIPAGASTLSRPIFRIPRDSSPVGLLLSHGLSPSRLVVGDPESLGHRPEILLLGTPRAAEAAALHRDIPPQNTTRQTELQP